MNEYRYSLYTPGLYYTSVPTFVRDNGSEHDTGFSSLYSVDLATTKALEQAGTTKEFKGVVWSERLWLDIDTKGLSVDASVELLNRVETRLKEMGLAFCVYDSGGHDSVGGGHFGILRKADPSHLLPQRDRQWAKRHFPEADSSIYTHLHLFRRPGTVHQITGRRKELVFEQAGKVLELPTLEVASPTFKVIESDNTESIFSNFNIMSLIGPRRNGERHFTLVKLAFELRDHGVDIQAAQWILGQNNLLFDEPKSFDEIFKIVQDVYSGSQK